MALFIGLVALFFTFLYIFYIFFPFFSFCGCVRICVFVWFCLFRFAYTICPRVLTVCVLGLFVCLFSFYKCVYVSLYQFACLVLLLPFGLVFYRFVGVFFFLFSSKPCGWQGLNAPARCQARASEMGEPSPGHWTTRDLLAPYNINQRKLLRSPSQH